MTSASIATLRESPGESTAPSALPLDRTMVIVPAYNEAKVARSVLREIRSVFPRVVCVDDGSSDGTLAESRSAGVEVLRHPVNVGQGGALETGIRYGLRHGARCFVTMDADGQHRVSDAVEMLRLLIQSGDDIVLGSRFLPRAGDSETPTVPLLKRRLLRAGTLISRVLHQLDLSDTHNGLRVFNANAASRMRFEHVDMAHASEIYDIIRRDRLRYREHAVRIRYTEYSRSKGQAGINAVNILADFILNLMSGGNR